MPKVVMFLSQDSFFLSHFVSYAEALKKSKFDVVVVARQTSPGVKKEILDQGYKFVSTDIERGAIGFFSLISGVRQIISIIHREKPDYLHNFGTKQIFLGTIAAKILKKNIKIINNLTGMGVVFSYSTVKNIFLQRLILIGYRLLLNPLKSRVICENKDDLIFFEKKRCLTRENAFLIPGVGVDVDKYYPGEIKERVVTAVMCSRLLRSKGTLDFLKAAEILKKKKVSVQLWLIGDVDLANPDSITLEDLSSWQKKEVCKIWGYRTDINKILKCAHIMVLPSYYREGFPKALIEGLAAGLAIITTDTVGCREAVVNNNGILIRPMDYLQLADQLETLSKNSKLIETMGRNSRKFAVDHLASSIIHQHLLEVYKSFGETKE